MTVENLHRLFYISKNLCSFLNSPAFWIVVFFTLESFSFFIKLNRINLFELIYFFMIFFNLYMIIYPILLLRRVNDPILVEFLGLSILSLIFLLCGYLTIYFAESFNYHSANIKVNVTLDERNSGKKFSKLEKSRLGLFLTLTTCLFLLNYLASIKLYYGDILYYLKGGHNMPPILENNLVGAFYGFIGVTGFTSFLEYLSCGWEI